nr:hypothetical protein [Tanacetum cinerariifolium]
MDHMITKTSTRSCDPFKHMEHFNQCRLYGELRFERWDHQCGCVFTFVHVIIEEGGDKQKFSFRAGENGAIAIKYKCEPWSGLG